MLTPFRFPGSKNKLLPQLEKFLDPLLKETNIFGDLFLGGGSVLLNVASRYPKINLKANDKDYNVYCFWKIIGGSNTSDISEVIKLLKIKPTIELFYKLRETPVTSEIEAAYRALFFNRTTFSGDMRAGASPIGGKNQLSKYTVDCRYNADKLIEKIKIINKLLAGRFSITNQDINSCEFITDTFPIYLDPPYYKAGKMLYQEYMIHEEHVKLSKILQERNKWILSYDNCVEIRDLYKLSNIFYIDAKYCIRGSKQSWHETKEIVILP